MRKVNRRPNIIFFCADQMRYDGVDCLGNSLIRTPNIGSIGTRGTRFHRHRTPHQICSPSRATMLTGLYPRHHRLYKNGNALDRSIPTLPSVLSEQGYATHGIGKFHLQPLLAPAEYGMPDSFAFWQSEAARGWRGPFYGFQTVDVLLAESQYCLMGGHYAEWFMSRFADEASLYAPSSSLCPVPDDLPEIWKSAIAPAKHYNSWIADQAVDFISKQTTESPFFLYLSSPDPHHPFSPPAPYGDNYDPDEMPMPQVVAGELERMPDYLHGDLTDEWLASGAFDDYQSPPAGSIEQGMMIKTDGISEASMRLAIAHTYGMIEMIDDSVGKVMSAIGDKGLGDNTICLFTSDHGELLGDHGLLRKGSPPYDQLVRLPMLMSGPGIPENYDIETPTSHIDLMATLCALAGADVPPTDGQSLLPLLNGQNDDWTRDTLFGEFYPRAHWDELNHSIFSGDWRLTLYPRRPEWGELFDHAQDPSEHRNLFYEAEFASVRAALGERLRGEFPAVLDEKAEVLGSY